MMRLLSLILLLALTPAFAGDGAEKDATPAEAIIQDETAADGFVVPRGTRVPLVLLNSVSTKHANPGDLIYLESVYPVVVDKRVAIPPGTYVSGKVTKSKRPGRVKGKGELYLRFEQMILPNGVIRDLVGRVGALDGRSPDNFDREEGKISSQSGAGRDAGTVIGTTTSGAAIGTIAGAAGDSVGSGAAIGAAAGAAAGLIGVLATRGPDAILDKGTQVDMVLDRNLAFAESELQFDSPLRSPRSGDVGPGPDPTRNRNRGGIGRLPL